MLCYRLCWWQWFQAVILKLPPLAISNARGVFFSIQDIWQVWAPSLWEHRWQLKGCWNDFTPTLVMTYWVSGETGKTLQICLNIFCVSEKCGRDLMLPVIASAEVRGPICLLHSPGWSLCPGLPSCPDFSVWLSASGHPVRSTELLLSGN